MMTIDAANLTMMALYIHAAEVSARPHTAVERVAVSVDSILGWLLPS